MEMIETKEETKQSAYDVDVRNIQPLNRAGGNIRVDYGDKDGSFQELVDSIRQDGILVPIRAYRDKDNEGKWIAIDGHRRLAAAMKLVEEGIEIRARVNVVDSRKISDEQLIYEMVTTNSGKSLSPLEMSDAVRRLIGYGHTPKEIAKKLCKTIDLVNNLALFGSAPKRLRELVQSNRVSYTLVVDLLRETKDYNEAISKIEKALDVSKAQAKKDYDPDTDTSEPLQYKATKKHLDIATNKLDSMKELQMAIRSIEEQGSFEDIKNPNLYHILSKISKNQATKNQIIELLTKNK